MNKLAKMHGVSGLHQVIKQGFQLAVISVSFNKQDGQFFYQPHQIAFTDMFLDEFQQRHPAMLHNLVIGHNGDIDQWKRGAIKLSGGLRVIKLVQPTK